MQPMKEVEARQQEFIKLLKQQADEGVVTISASGEQDTYI
jgi:flagellar motor switch protein FliG